MRMKNFTSKFLLAAAALLVGGVSSAWAAVSETVVVNCDFNNGETLFTGASRITVSNDNNVKFANASNSANGYTLATYDFSSAIGEDATAIKVEFAYWIPNSNSAYYRYFTLGQASLRSGFGKSTYSTSGAMFGMGLKRGKWNGTGSNVNYFSVNNGYTSQTGENVLGAWARAEVYIDFSSKKISYKITNVDNTETYFSADDVDYMDETASYCNQIDFFDCANNEISYLDNLVITKYKDDSKVATTYTVKYQNASGVDLKEAAVYDTYVGDIFTASASDMATFYNADESKKYIYASGNTSAEATSTAADNVVTLVFNEYDKVAYTITAKCGETTLGTLAEGDAYTDGSTTKYWSKFVNFNDQWYETTANYGKAITEAGNTDVNFTLSNIVYFFEMENLTRSGGAYLTEENIGYSNNARLRLSKGSLYYTPALAAGDYTLEIGVQNSNNSSSEVYVYTRSGEGELSEVLYTHTAEKGSSTINAVINVPEGYSIAFNGDEGSYNNNARMDYMTLTKVTSSITPAAGLTTYVTTKALDFTGVSGLKAYAATAAAGGVVTLTEVTAAVPAGTPLILEGTAGTEYTVPVVASASALAGNMLKAGDGTSEFTGETYDYLLAADGKFHQISSGTIAVGKAYLHCESDPTAAGARALTIQFGDKTTGINKVEAAVAEGAEIYNMLGQRVAQPTKGLYIVNGKKVIIK